MRSVENAECGICLVLKQIYKKSLIPFFSLKENKVILPRICNWIRYNTLHNSFQSPAPCADSGKANYSLLLLLLTKWKNHKIDFLLHSWISFIYLFVTVLNSYQKNNVQLSSEKKRKRRANPDKKLTYCFMRHVPLIVIYIWAVKLF